MDRQAKPAGSVENDPKRPSGSPGIPAAIALPGRDQHGSARLTHLRLLDFRDSYYAGRGSLNHPQQRRSSSGSEPQRGGVSFSRMCVAINLSSALRNSAANTSSDNALGGLGVWVTVVGLAAVTLGKSMIS